LLGPSPGSIVDDASMHLGRGFDRDMIAEMYRFMQPQIAQSSD